MTLFYLKWEEFFGAWLEKHGQSILIVYDLESVCALTLRSTATYDRAEQSAQVIFGLRFGPHVYEVPDCDFRIIGIAYDFGK